MGSVWRGSSSEDTRFNDVSRNRPVRKIAYRTPVLGLLQKRTRTLPHLIHRKLDVTGQRDEWISNCHECDHRLIRRADGGPRSSRCLQKGTVRLLQGPRPTPSANLPPLSTFRHVQRAGQALAPTKGEIPPLARLLKLYRSEPVSHRQSLRSERGGGHERAREQHVGPRPLGGYARC